MNFSATLTPLVSDRDHFAGPPHALATLVEYGDYQCPYCGAAHPVVNRLRRHFGNRLRFVFRNFPLTQSHPYAMVAAEAAESAALQGKFWEMHDFIFEHQNELEPNALLEWAQELGLDLEAFGAAIRQGDITKRIKEDRAGGVRSGVNGTPCFFIDGVRYDEAADFGPMRAALEEQINSRVT